MLSQNNPLLEYQMKFWRESLKPTLNQALELAPIDKLDWAPADKMIPLGKLFIHISEASDWWYDEVMKGKTLTGRAYADKPSPAKETIAHYLETHWERMERLFSEPSEVLGKTYKIEHEGKTHSLDGYWIFTHLLEHDIHHRSQINQYLRILGIAPPKI
ncbi:MAG: DinB family protein [candidate division Zixibacteria bacterium]|nr:DinB family protein [candidate division Zixibacteria bacterium]